MISKTISGKTDESRIDKRETK